MSDFVEAPMQGSGLLQKPHPKNRRLRRLALPLLLFGALVAVVPQSALVKDQSYSLSLTSAPKPIVERSMFAPTGKPKLERGALLVGDKLKIDIFQRNGGPETQGLSATVAKNAASWGLRQEVSGNFNVQEDGTLVLPVLGSFVGVNRTTADLAEDIVANYRRAFNAEARAAVTISERPPIYVVGAVKSPGSYKYESGLTALHAIALSGGSERGATDSWSTIELAREGAKAESAKLVLKSAAAELAVLRAERDGAGITVPEDLIGVFGREAATSAVNKAHASRKARLEAQEKQRQTLKLGVDIAMKNMALDEERLAVLTKGANARTKRVDILQGFVTKGVSSQAVLNQAQAESSDHDDRALGARSHLGEAEYRVSMARQELTKFDLERLVERESAILSLEKDVVAAQSALTLYLSMSKRLSLKGDSPGPNGGQQIEIVRKNPEQALFSPAEPTITLNPGDLVRVLNAGSSSLN